MRTHKTKTVDGVKYSLMEEPDLGGLYRYWRAFDGVHGTLPWSDEDEAEFGDD